MLKSGQNLSLAIVAKNRFLALHVALNFWLQIVTSVEQSEAKIICPKLKRNNKI